MVLKTLKDIPGLLREAMKLLQKNDPLRMAGATAFFTIFALPAVLVILIQALGLVFRKDKVRAGLLNTLSDSLGNESVEQVNETLMGFRNLADNWLITLGGFIFLIFVATNLLSIIKRSINQIWEIHSIKKRFLRRIKNRGKSVMVILFAGFLFVIGLMGESLQVYLGASIKEWTPALMPLLTTISNVFISVVIVSGWFIILFRYLPDGRPAWKVAIIGGLVTSVLFSVGKWVLHWLLSYSNLNSIFGTSASIILLLLFVFYSALIFYYGAAFTKVLSNYLKQKIMPVYPD